MLSRLSDERANLNLNNKVKKFVDSESIVSF